MDIDALLAEVEKRKAMGEADIAEFLGVPVQEARPLLKKLVQEDWLLTRQPNGRYVTQASKGNYKGRIIVKPAGFGFVVIGQGRPDVYVPAEGVRGAMDGEEVLVHVEPGTSMEPGSRVEGLVSKILTPLPVEVVGVFHIAPDPRMGGHVSAQNAISVQIPPSRTMGASDEARVVCEVTKRAEAPGESPLGQITEILGNQGDPGIDILVYARRFGLEASFPDACVAQAERCERDVPSPEGRLDLRDRRVITIDGADSKDLDDAVSLERLPNGNWELGVHIADVSHYVTENSPLDKEALRRGTSVYLVDRVVPMLPKELSNGICSLNPQEDKLTLSCIMEIAPDGTPVSHNIANSIICTTERMTYDDVNLILGGDPEKRKRYASIADMCDNMNELAKVLRERRFAEGSLDFDLPEPKITMDENSHPISVVVRERGDAEKLIEEFMLRANVTVAEQFYHMEVPFLYRVHETPGAEKVQELSAFLNNMGIHLKGTQELHPKAYQDILDKVAGRPEAGIVQTIVLRSLEKARYDTEPIAHFGLAAPQYCHFTSPIRRYPDLIVHRIVKLSLAGKLDEDMVDHLNHVLPGIAEQTSEMERNAITAERAVVAMEMAEYMQDHLFEPSETVVSGVAKFGVFVQMPNTIEGMIPMASLDDDYYEYYENLYCLIGEHTRRRITLGDQMKAQAVGANPELGRVEFAPIWDEKPDARKATGSGAGARAPKPPRTPAPPQSKGTSGGSSNKGGRRGGRGGQQVDWRDKLASLKFDDDEDAPRNGNGGKPDQKGSGSSAGRQAQAKGSGRGTPSDGKGGVQPAGGKTQNAPSGRGVSQPASGRPQNTSGNGAAQAQSAGRGSQPSSRGHGQPQNGGRGGKAIHKPTGTRKPEAALKGPKSAPHGTRHKSGSRPQGSGSGRNGRGR